jgi:hypothetical protein
LFIGRSQSLDRGTGRERQKKSLEFHLCADKKRKTNKKQNKSKTKDFKIDREQDEARAAVGVLGVLWLRHGRQEAGPL